MRNETEVVIVRSQKDPAGLNIGDSLIEKGNFRESSDSFDGKPIFRHNLGLRLLTASTEIIFSDHVRTYAKGCSFIFISKHRAESGIPSLTAHFTGNFGPTADFGGSPNELSVTNPVLLKNYLLRLNARRAEIPHKFGITIEATHHGPTCLPGPLLFVELGSGPEDWLNKEVANIICEALLDSLLFQKSYDKCAIALGGTHYSDKFNNFLLNSDYALTHIVPKYAMDFVDGNMIRQILDKTPLQVGAAVLDWKGLGTRKKEILHLIMDLGLETIRL